MNSWLLYLTLSLIALSHCVDVMYNHTNQENNLYFVFTTFRHGARKPLYRNDYFGNNKYPAGALTTYGAIQHLEIGRNYRKRYSNFVNLDFDKNELYIRSSDVGRTLISTEKELEGFFNKTIDRSNIVIARGGGYFMNLFHLDPKEQAEMNKYLASCPKKRNLGKNFNDIFYSEIFPNIKKCELMGNIKDSGMGMFCDTMISHYFEYSYGNETNNIITRCSKENIQKFYDFCVEYYDSFRGWNEIGAYMFYMLFQHIFQNMDNYINGRSKMRMMMIGGHDVTVAPLMDFLSGLNIIPRTHYPHYACNVVMELRKYGQDFYLEIYYNDVLKYNNTLEIFKSIINNSKFSNLYNYCGVPSYLNIPIKNATNQTVKNESKIENAKNVTNNTIINNQTLKKESINENVKNETNPIVNNQTERNDNATQNDEKNSTDLLNNNETLVKKNETNNKNQKKNFVQKSFNYLAKQDMNFYIILISIFVIVATLVGFAIFYYFWNKNKRKRYIKFKETVSKNVNSNNLSVMSSNDTDIKNEPQSNA